MTAPPPLIARSLADVKADLHRLFAEAIDPLLDAAASGELSRSRDAELRLWTAMLAVGRAVLAALFAILCRRRTEDAVHAAGLEMSDVELRTDRDYWTTLTSTFGRVSFPMAAYRHPETGRTEVPARDVFPLYPKVRSTDVCIEWESMLAADNPFRKAAEALGFFTHGAVDLEDNTIERHAVMVGSAIPQRWLYLTKGEIREALLKHATCDAKTGRPIVYVSTDAHSLKRYVDDTWKPEWKMCNGIRVWCVDRDTEKIIHLGGEYTWGDCREVAERFVALHTMGLVPSDGDYGDGLVAQVAILTDGLDWIVDHVVPLFPGAVLILDVYHVLEQVAEAARAAFPRSKRKAKQASMEARKALGVRNRRGRTVKRKGGRRRRHAKRPSGSAGNARKLLPVLERLHKAAKTKRGRERVEKAIAYVARNVGRTDYGDLRERGFQIGSGAMESMHRTGSQIRLKRAGCRWTGEVAQAILNLRMLTLVGRWDEYWGQPDLMRTLAERRAA